MNLEVNFWRPQESVFFRLAKGLDNLSLSSMGKRWSLEYFSFEFLTGLMNDCHLNKLKLEQKKALAHFFQEVMYFNHYLDLLTFRCQNGRQSYEFLENFWFLPQRINQLKEKGRKAGYPEEVLEEIDGWFLINRLLNFVAYELAGRGKIDWEKYGLPQTELEQELQNKIQSAFEFWQTEDPIAAALLFRSFSSMALGRCLLTLTLGKREINERLSRTGSMIMIAQLLDDLVSPAKDVKYQIQGVIASSLRDSKLNDADQLEVSTSDSRRVISLIQEILEGCLDVAYLDPEKPFKRNLAKKGLLGLMSVAQIFASNRYGGTIYPLKETFSVFLNQNSKEKLPFDYQQITKEALILACSSLSY